MGTVMNIIASLMVIGGLIAGAGYPIYIQGYSGHKVDTIDIPSGAGVLRPVGIGLDPQMNPVTLIVSGRVNKFFKPTEHWYRASLYLGKLAVVQKSVSLRTEGEKPGYILASYAISEVELPSAGRYEFVLEEMHNPDLAKVTARKVEVRRNVKVLDWRVVWWGLGVCVGGFLLGFLFGGAVPVNRRQK